MVKTGYVSTVLFLFRVGGNNSSAYVPMLKVVSYYIYLFEFKSTYLLMYYYPNIFFYILF